MAALSVGPLSWPAMLPAMARRNAQQTLFATVALVIGVWATFQLMSLVTWRRSETEFAPELPDIEVRGLSPEELFERHGGDADRPGFRRRASDPKTWADIYLRLYGAEGEYVKLQRCTIDADEVEQVSRRLLSQPARRRAIDDRPPAWFPLVTDQDDPWRVPEWWHPPRDGISTYHWQHHAPFTVGQYLHYDPATRLMHLWEFKRKGLTPPQRASRTLMLDYLVVNLSAALRRDQTPHVEGWYDIAGRSARSIGLPEEMLPPGLHAIDGLLFPWQTPDAPEGNRYRYFLRLHGLSLDDALRLAGEVPLRPLADDQPPPLDDWSFALAEGPDGQYAPSWFDPGPGPRFAFSLARPGSGQVERGRWLAQDRVSGHIYVWDWHFSHPRDPQADLWLTAPPADDASQDNP